MAQEKFHYKSLDEVKQKMHELGVEIPLSENLGVLGKPITVCGRKVQNRLAIQPMEGCDGTTEGAPDLLTRRRYDRFAHSGAGLIWFEAVAIAPEGRANPRQLMLTEKNLDEYKALVEHIRETALKETGVSPILIMQATHSGRYCKPYGKPEPIIAYHSPIFEKDKPISDDRIISDDGLKRLEELYGHSARLAQQAGFDGVDVKACHRYLMCETLSGFTRPGEYGGSFENRTRFYRNAIAAAKASLGQSFVTSRLNIYDGFPRPYGWGAAKESVEPDLEEPIELVRILNQQFGIELLDYTIGNPYFNPHVNRPYDVGPYESPEHPFVGVARMCECVSRVKKAVPEVTVISSGLSYLRQFSQNQAAGMVESGGADLAGFGRQAFAYPEFAGDILAGGLDPKKCCITCSKCTELMRAVSTAGCVVRDAETYLPIYRRDVMENPEDIAHKVSGM